MSRTTVIDPGFRPIMFDPPAPASLPLKHTTDRILVTHGGHVIGSRSFSGLRHGLVPVETEYGPVFVMPHMLAFCGDDAVHTMLFVSDRDHEGFAETDDVPAPFDRLKVGGERLPDPPAY